MSRTAGARDGLGKRTLSRSRRQARRARSNSECGFLVGAHVGVVGLAILPPQSPALVDVPQGNVAVGNEGNQRRCRLPTWELSAIILGAAERGQSDNSS